MNREILFRGKRIDNNEWIEGGYAKHDGKVFIVTWVMHIPDTRDWDTADYYENNPHYNSTFIEVIPETVCQYTGLTDKNGRKIFEGDIVKNEYGYIGIVKWECCALVLDWLSWSASRDLYLWGSSSEVVGNIFDNPELLKE